MLRLLSRPAVALLCCGVKATSATTFRFSSTTRPGGPVLEDLEVPGRIDQDGTDSAVSTQVRRDEEHDNSTDSTDEPFDELEASAQELHDLAYAMISHLRKSVPNASDTRVLVQRRQHRKFRETVDIRFRCPVHRRPYDGKFNNYASQKELKTGNTQYCEMGEKMMLLLTKDVVDRMLSNTKRLSLIEKTDSSVFRRQNVIDRVLATRFRTAAHYHHAPFEIQNLRSDIPESYVLHSRALRDRSTMSSLFSLMEPNHPYRQQIESRLWEIMEKPNAEGASPI